MFAARVSSPKQFEIIDIDMPVAQDGQCLIKLERWSVCGSDIRHGYGPVYAEEEYPMRLGAPCHETVGTIIESKSDKFNEGQRVIVLPGSETGALVEYMAGQEDRMVALPDEGTSEEWLMCQPSGTVLYSVQQAGTVLGKSVMVMGQGSIGLSFTAICARAGARQVIAVDPLDNRLAFAKRFGATHTINPAKENLDEAVNEITKGEGAEISIEAAGFPDTLNNALKHVAKWGKVILFGIQGGLPGDMTPVNMSSFLAKMPTIIPTVGAVSGDAVSHIENMVELKQRGWWDPGEMATHTKKFDDIKAAYDMYENYEDEVVKVVLSA
ncbi:MAG: zinc-binding dehydrogenase [Dehalococcoidia bacterium]|nr:zinc-binding dehydrogenase [Dehalococcoidia bacterium]